MEYGTWPILTPNYLEFKKKYYNNRTKNFFVDYTYYSLVTAQKKFHRPIECETHPIFTPSYLKLKKNIKIIGLKILLLIITDIHY